MKSPLIIYPVIGLIKLYQYSIAPLLAPCCRFYPSCSHYAEETLRKYGLIRGIILTVSRVSKCHPFHPGGYDPVK